MNGVLDKGMQAWKDQLGPVRVRQAVAYVLTRKGLNLPGKAPQGKSTADWAKENAATGAAKPAAATNTKATTTTAPTTAPVPPAATPPASTPAPKSGG
jgi:hypothetical protein